MDQHDVTNVCLILAGLVTGSSCHQPASVTADQVAYAICLYKQVRKQTAEVKPEAEAEMAKRIADAVAAALAAAPAPAAPAPAPAPEPAPAPAPEGGTQ